MAGWQTRGAGTLLRRAKTRALRDFDAAYDWLKTSNVLPRGLRYRIEGRDPGSRVAADFITDLDLDGPCRSAPWRGDRLDYYRDCCIRTGDARDYSGDFLAHLRFLAEMARQVVRCSDPLFSPPDEVHPPRYARLDEGVSARLVAEDSPGRSPQDGPWTSPWRPERPEGRPSRHGARRPRRRSPRSRAAMVLRHRISVVGLSTAVGSPPRSPTSTPLSPASHNRAARKWQTR